MSVCVIATPHGRGVEPEYYRRIMSMQGQFQQHQFLHVEIDLMIIGKARNILVQEFLNTHAEVIWFIDDDILVPLNSGVLIDQALQYGIVSGLYFNRHSPYTPQMYRTSPLPEEAGLYEAIIDYPEEGLVHSMAVGAGCLAIRRDVLEKMATHHKEKMDAFLEKVEGLGESWIVQYAKGLSPWFEFLDQKGEDFYFCEKAREAGFPIWTNVEVKCEHLGSIPIQEGHFAYLRDNNLLIRMDLEGKPIDDPRYKSPQTVGATEVPSEDIDDSPTGAEALERGDDLPGAVGGFGVSSDLPSTLPGTEGE